MTMTPAQLRAARALLDWSVDTLAARAGLSPEAVLAAESGRPASPADLDALEKALRAGGVEPVGADGGGEGVRFQRAGTAGDQGLTPDELNSANDG